MKPQGFFRAVFMQFWGSDVHMSEEPILFFVDDVFRLPDRKVEFFRQRLEAHAIYQSAFQDCSVSLIMDVFVD